MHKLRIVRICIRLAKFKSSFEYADDDPRMNTLKSRILQHGLRFFACLLSDKVSGEVSEHPHVPILTNLCQGKVFAKKCQIYSTTKLAIISGDHHPHASCALDRHHYVDRRNHNDNEDHLVSWKVHVGMGPRLLSAACSLALYHKRSDRRACHMPRLL